MSAGSDALWLTIGWTMLHFLWVGGLIAIAAAVLLRALRGASAEVRYAAALASLAMLAAAPGAIAWREMTGGGDGGQRPIERAGTPAIAAIPQAVARPIDGAPGSVVERAIVENSAAVPTGSVPARAAMPAPPASVSRLDAMVARLPWLWLAGSPITFAWLALGLAGAERLRRGATAIDGELSVLCGRLSRELGIARAVGVAACDRLAVPVLVGVVKPMILLPAAALAGWAPDQLEMILLHELAHVRRWDNLVNLSQRLIESALFFHPAVWIVSGWVRREREHCCDAIVVAHTGRARAYAETLLALAGTGPARVPRAAVAMARNDLVGRVGRILDLEPKGHAMKLPRALLALTAAVLIVPAGWTISWAHRAESPRGAGAQDKVEPKGAAARDGAAGGPTTIQGKTVAEWQSALKDRDPAVRRQAVETLAEHLPAAKIPEKDRRLLQIAVRSLALSDKDEDVREAAAFFADLQRVAGSPEMLKRAIEERKRVVRPTRTAIRLVDAQGRPVAGALASDFFHRDADRDPDFGSMEPGKTPMSDERGELTLKLDVPGHREAAAVYAIRRDGEHFLVGIRRVTREEIRASRPVTVEMHPACRVRLRVECPGFREIEEKYQVDLRAGGWWRAAYVWLGEDHQSPRPLFTSSSTGELEFLLPPGRYMIMAYGADVKGVERVVEVKPDHRVLNLGVLEVAPTEEIKQGRFRGFWRSIRPDPEAAPDDRNAKPIVSRRRARGGALLKGETRNAIDVAFSPDGKRLATAHSYSADPGEVKLWDTATGALVATLPLADRGIASIAFSPDGKLLAGQAHPMAAPSSSEVVLWDVAARRELRRLGGPDGRIGAMAFSPDGRSLASCGGDRTLRFWDVASGRETRRVDGMGPGRALAFSPDGKALAINGPGGALVLWDVAAGRPRATLEAASERFTASTIAFAPDGRSLAAIGSVSSPDGRGQLYRDYLYDLTQDPPARRAQLVLAPPENGRRAPTGTGDIAFTPDGRRLVGVMLETIAIWDAATGAERETLERDMGSTGDRLAVSPDGRWLAITQPAGNGAGLIDIGPETSTRFKVPNVNIHRRAFTGF